MLPAPGAPVGPSPRARRRPAPLPPLVLALLSIPIGLGQLGCGTPSQPSPEAGDDPGKTVASAADEAALEALPMGVLVNPEPGLDALPGLEALRGRLISRWPAFFVPGRGWKRIGEDGAEPHWRIEGQVELSCLLGLGLEPGDASVDGATLSFHLPVLTPTVDAPTIDAPTIDAHWIDDAGEQHALEVGPWDEDGERKGLHIRVPSSLVRDGRHTLRLHVDAPLDLGPIHANFDGLPKGTEVADRSRWGTSISPGLRLAFDYLDELLRLGVSGSYGAERLGGMVFLGPLRRRFDLPSDGGGTLRFRTQNSSQEPAVFHLRAGSATLRTEVGSHQRANLELEVPPGVGTVEAAVDGPGVALYLWGAPHFEPRQPKVEPPAIAADTAPRTILLVTLDTTRRDFLGVYGADPSPTPNIDAWAADALVFDRARSTAPWTLPSHASMFTGWYPSHHGVGVTLAAVPDGLGSLGQRLGEAGYRRAGFAGGPLASYRYGLARGFDSFTSPTGFETPGRELTDGALDFVDASGDVPLFLFINYFDAHLPFQPPEDLRRQYRLDERIEAIEGPWRAVLENEPQALSQLSQGLVPAEPEALAIFRDLYRAEVAEVDRQVGRLFDGLEARGRLDGALVILIADHGELLGEHGRYSHSYTLHPELIEIPLLVRPPGGAATVGGAGVSRHIPHPVSAVDVFPTVLKAAGLGLDGPRRDGLDLLGQRLGRRPRVVSEEHEMAVVHGLLPELRIAPRLYGIHRADDREFWLWADGHRCLHGRGAAQQEVDCDGEALARARAVAEALEKEIPRPTETNFELDPEERARLQALGYVD